MRFDVSNRDDRAESEHLSESDLVSAAEPAPLMEASRFFTLPLVGHTALWLIGVGLGIALFRLFMVVIVILFGDVSQASSSMARSSVM